MATRTLQITYVGDASRVLAAQKQIDAGHTKMQGGVTKTSGVFKSAFQTAIPFATVAAGAAVVKLAQTTITAASDQNEALNRTRVIFGEAAQSVVAFSDRSAESFGISKTAALDAAGSFGAMLDAAGFVSDAAADMSTTLVGLAGDLASFSNADPSEMLERLRSGLAGEAEPLRRFGIFISEARVKTEAYASGIAKAGEELTDAQKIQARYNIILQDSTKAQGDFGRTVGESLPNQIRQLKAEFTDLAAEIGQKLLPALLEAAKALRAVIDIISNPTPWDQSRLAQEQFGQAFATWVEVAMKEAPEALDMVAQGAGGVSEEMQMMAQAAQQGITDWQGLAEVFVQNDMQMEGLIERYKSQTAETDRLSAAAEAYTLRTQEATGATEDLAASSEEAAAASREQKLALLALTDTFFGILDAANQVSDAQRTLNELERRGRDDTKAYEQAVLDAIEAQAGLEDAVLSYAEELVDAGQTTKDVKAKIRELADQFGIQDSVVQDLIQRVLAYIRALDNIPSSVTTDVRIRGGGQGGVQLQHGGIVTKPTFALIGEAGPEAVIPLRKGAVSSGGAPTTVNVTVNGWVGNDQDLARMLRDELVKLQRRNMTTGIK